MRTKSFVLHPVLIGNLTDDLEKQQGASPMLLQALSIIQWSFVNSDWSQIYKHSTWVKIGDSLSHVTLKFDV